MYKKVEAEILKHSSQLKNMPPYPDTYYVLQRTKKAHLRIIKPAPSIYKITVAA